MKHWLILVLALMTALQSAVATADLDQVYHPGVDHHATEQWHSSDGNVDTQSGEQPPAEHDSASGHCHQCHGHLQVVLLNSPPDALGTVRDHGPLNYQINLASGAPSTPYRPPIS